MKFLLSLLIIQFFIFTTSCSTIKQSPENRSALFPSHIPSNICYLNTVRSQNFIFGRKISFNATGTIIDGQYLITAGHNVYDSFWTKFVEVDVVYKSSSGKIVTTNISNEMIQKSLKISHYDDNGHSYSYDYAFLKLTEPIDVTESIKLGAGKEINKINHIEVAGYPSGILKYGKGSVLKPIPKNHTFSYDIDTAKGMSGGPVWANDYLVGIHVSEGMARTVDGELINEFNKWKDKLK